MPPSTALSKQADTPIVSPMDDETHSLDGGIVMSRSVRREELDETIPRMPHVEELFLSALDLPTAQRATFLDRNVAAMMSCAGKWMSYWRQSSALNGIPGAAEDQAPGDAQAPAQGLCRPPRGQRPAISATLHRRFHVSARGQLRTQC